MIIPPALVLSFVVSSLYAFVFYLIFGQGWAQLVLYWMVGVVGFVAGELIARAVGFVLFNIGDVSIVEGTLVSWLSLVVIRAWRRR